MDYAHRQYGHIHQILALGWLAFVPLFVARPDLPLAILFVIGVVFALVALAFRHLDVVDEGDSLAIRYGPLPFFSKSVPYGDIAEVRAGRSRVVDGWGIHWIPGRGWTYNLWGFDCVELMVGKRQIRIGTDDVERLEAFLKSKAERKATG